MQRLWAPWRIAYLESENGTAPCFLCQSAAETGTDGLVVWRGKLVFALLNAFPYASGHVLVAPYVHEGDPLRLPDETVAEMTAALRRMIVALKAEYAPDGMNIGANVGGAAGAGLAEHLHLHVVPRWRGDTNFMTATADARVLPEALDRTAERLRRAVALSENEESQ